MSETVRTLWLSPKRTNILFYFAAVLLGLTMGGLIFLLPPLYLLFVAGGLIFAYLLLVKLDVAIILALFLQRLLTQYNYLGGGTPFHPNGLMGLAIIVAAIFYFAFNKVQISQFRRVGFFLLFFLVGLSSTLMVPPQYFMASLTVTIRLATALCIFAALLVKLDSVQKVQWMLVAIIGAQAFLTISKLAVRAGSTGLSFTRQTLRLGDSGLGIMLGLVLTLCAVFLLDASTDRGRILWGSLTALFALGLYFSFGRSGWISFLAAMIMIGLMRHKWVLVVAPLALLLALLLVPGISERFADISITDPGSGTSTLALRIKVWREALDFFASKPVFGVGIGASAAMVGEALQEHGWMMHNDYLSVLVETGLVGIVLFLLWQGEWLASVYNAYKTSNHAFDRTFILGVLAVLVASLVGRFTDNILLDSYDMYPLCALAAAALALPGIRAKMEKSRE